MQCVKVSNLVNTCGDRTLACDVLGYLGRQQSHDVGVNLAGVFDNIDATKLEGICTKLNTIQNDGGRVFVIGNGGSFDNARLIVAQLRQAGLCAQIPGSPELYRTIALEHRYEDIFWVALQRENFSAKDLLIGLSGSGNSPNILKAFHFANFVRFSTEFVSNVIAELTSRGFKVMNPYEGFEVSQLQTGSLLQVKNAVVRFHKAVAEISQYKLYLAAKDCEVLGELLGTLEASSTLLAFGGRDGGSMCQLAGIDNSVIAATDCMEAIEDIHPLQMAAVSQTLRSGGGVSLGEALSNVRQCVIEKLRSPGVREKLIDLASAIEKTIFRKAKIFLLGDSERHPVLTHMEADWGRGIVQKLPIAGPSCVRFDNLNAWMAANNDDGPDFWLADELYRFGVEQNDVVLFIGNSLDSACIQECLAYAQGRSDNVFILGASVRGRKADFAAAEVLVDVVGTVVMHTVSKAVNDYIRGDHGVGWVVERADVENWPKELRQFLQLRMCGNKKLGHIDRLALEKMLRAENLLSEGKIITWCHGTLFFADTPAKYGLE